MSPARLRQIFLSCVTDEIAQHREKLTADLSLPGVKVQVQEDFVQGGGKLLQTLDTYIRDHGDAVIHLVGSKLGQALKPDEVRWLLETYGDFAERFDISGAGPAGLPPTLTYTQMEASLALYHGKRCHLYRPVTWTRTRFQMTIRNSVLATAEKPWRTSRHIRRLAASVPSRAA